MDKEGRVNLVDLSLFFNKKLKECLLVIIAANDGKQLFDETSSSGQKGERPEGLGFLFLLSLYAVRI